MKYILYIAFFSLLLVVACIRKNPKPAPVTPKEQLPPYTETGANTFGCLIDGEVFVPGKPAFSSYKILQCEYQYVNGIYKFRLFAFDNLSTLKNGVYLLGSGNNDFIDGDTIYQVAQPKEDAIVCGIGRAYTDSSWDNKINYQTTETHKGELNIKHFDSINQIISGTFWFDAVDTVTGQIIKVTDGRFDVSYYK